MRATQQFAQSLGNNPLFCAPNYCMGSTVRNDLVLEGVCGRAALEGTKNALKETVVIGHYPQYVIEAEKMGTEYFSLHNFVWYSMTETE